MRNPFRRPFFAVFQNEVLLNSRRVTPYVLMLLFSANAVMWSVKGTAVVRGWTTNSDYNIARNFLGFSWILGLPIFTAVILLLGMTVFYTGETMHRDRELKIVPVLWATPIPNSVLLLSKFLATILLGLSLMVLVGALAIAIQILKGDTPINISAYLIAYSVILLPSIVFMTGTSVALNVLLRDKYVAYAVSIGISAALFYLYSQGYNHWLYNPMLYQLWNYADLTGAGNTLGTILTHRLYCLAITSTCLSFAHLFFQRKSTRRFLLDGSLSGSGWSFLIAIVSLAVSVIAGLVIARSTPE